MAQMRKPTNYQKDYYQKNRTKRIAESCEYQTKHAAQRKIYNATYQAANKEKIAAQTKAYRERTRAARLVTRKAEYAANPEKFKKAAKEWHAANPEKRKRQRLRKYGLTLEGYNELLDKQNGACAICGHDDASQALFFPVVDHCHSKNVVRGLLCMNCNQGLGKFKDDVALLRAAVKYLSKKRN